MLVVIVTVFTGCTDEATNQVEGSLNNDTDQSVYVEFHNDVTGENWHIGVAAESSRVYRCKPGTYSLVGRFGSDSDFPDELIDTMDLDIKPTDSYFSIRITNSTLTGGSD